MAIYGDLNSHPFNDIIRILQRHTGILFMPTALDGHGVELHLNQGILSAVFVNNASVHEVAEVQKIVKSLVNQANGEYSFNFNDKVINHHFSIPMMVLIREAMGTAQIPEQQLPHQSTQFKSVSKLPLIPNSLQFTWLMLQPLLSQGASAEDVNRQFQLGVMEARMILYRFRVAGLIEPQRAVDLQVAQSSRQNVVRNLLYALRRLTKKGVV